MTQSTEADPRADPANTTDQVHGSRGRVIADQLRDAIIDGDYLPGERLRQDLIADRFGVSRIPAREALRILQSEGLVTLVANTGAWVTTLSLAEYQELYEMRERLEPLLLRLSQPALTPAIVDTLQHLADQMEQALSVEEFLRLDRNFHLATAHAVPTVLLANTVVGLWNRTHHYRRAVTRLLFDTRDRSVHHDHQLIAGALRRGDAGEAADILALHIRRTRLQLAKHPEVFER